jgi:hypothetical protein
MRQEQLINEQIYDLRKEHKAVYQAWNANAIYIKYVGAQETATAEVKSNSLELAAPSLTVLYDIDLTHANYNLLSELVAYINGLADWECSLGDQFEGTEASLSLTVIGATSVLTGVWFAQDTNLQIKTVLPTVSAGKKIKITKIIYDSTYSSGTSLLKIYKGSDQVWEETANSTTVEKESPLPALDGNISEAITIKVVNSAVMTAGKLVVAYEERYADAVPIVV